MKLDIKITKQITLQLTENEARWLKGIMQNPIGISSEKEPEQNYKMRKHFWKALTDVKLY
jgi:hypothetical protein